MNLPDGCDRDARFDFLLSTAVPELADIRSRYRLRQTADNVALGRAAMVGLHDPDSTKRLAALTALAMRRMTPKCCPIAARLLASTTLQVGPGSRGGALLGAMSAVALREKVSSLIAALAPGNVTWLTQDREKVTGRAEEVLKLVASQAGERAALCPVSPAFPEPNLELLSSVVDELAMCVDQQLTETETETETEWARWILVEGRLVRTPPPPPPGMFRLRPWPHGSGGGDLPSAVDHEHQAERAAPEAEHAPDDGERSSTEPHQRLQGQERSLFEALLALGPGRYVDGDSELLALLRRHDQRRWGRVEKNYARSVYSKVQRKLADLCGGYQLLSPDPSRKHQKGGLLARYGIKG